MGLFKDHQKSEITTIMDEIIQNKSLNTRKLNKVLELIDLKDDKSIYTQQNNLMELSRILRKSLKYGVSVNERILALDVMDYIIDKLDPEEIDNKNFLRDKKLNDNLKLAYVGRPYAMNKIQKGKDIKLLQETTMNYINTAWSQKYPYFRSYLELYVDPASNNVIDYASDSDSTSQRKRRQPTKKKKAYLKDSADPSVLPEDLQYGIPIIDANKLSTKINAAVADAHRASSLLENRLTSINKRVYSNDDEEATKYFIKVREQRRKILRYLQLVTEGEYLGILLKCNDDMVQVLDRYDALSSLEPDEYYESENEYNGPTHLDNQRNTGQDSYFSDDESFEDRRSVHSNSNPFEDTFHI